SAARVGQERRERPRIFLFLVRAEREPFVLHDWAAGPRAGDRRVERAGIEGQAGRILADVRLIARPVVDRPRHHVRAAPRDGVDTGADEVPLAHVVWRDLHLDLLDRFERDRGDAGAVADGAGRNAEAERVVEIRTVDRDVVRTVVLTGKRAGPAVLRRQARDVGDAAGNGRQHREVLAQHRGRRTGMRRAEDRIALADDGDRLGDRRDLERELEILRHAEYQGEIVFLFGREAGQRRGH